MGLLEKITSKLKKPWNRMQCVFELQEYGLRDKQGWSSIVEPTGKPPTKEECKEVFKPDSHYRVVARAIEESPDGKYRAGQYVGTVWTHYEPYMGLKEKEKAKPAPKPARPPDIVSAMDEYAEEVGRVLTPLGKLLESLDNIRAQLIGPQPEGVPQSSPSAVPTLEFEGKAPWWIHPYIAHTLAEEVKGVIDHGAERLEEVMGRKPLRGEVEEEEEKPLLPPIRRYQRPEAVREEEVSEEEYEEEIPEEEWEEEGEVAPEEVEIPGLEAGPEVEEVPEELAPETEVEEVEEPEEVIEPSEGSLGDEELMWLCPLCDYQNPKFNSTRMHALSKHKVRLIRKGRQVKALYPKEKEE